MPEGKDVPDVNKIAAEFVIAATERLLATVSTPAKTALRRTIQAISNAYQQYLEQTFIRVRTIRTFLKPSEPIDLLSHYVPVILKLGDMTYGADRLVTIANKGGKAIVSGLAGRGKSVLMRFIAISLYHSPQGKIPLFLELRSLNSLTTKDILQYVHAQYKGNSNVSYGDFLKVFEKGYFTLLLDGFDELNPEARPAVEQQIIEISILYPDVPIIVSGRPDERFKSWEHFELYSICPMTLKQTQNLIEISGYDEQVVKTFIKRLTTQFFKEHESFLSTPLLAIMLMITFEEYAEIPTSLHVFYRNAFETLMRRHDAMKSQFLRTTHSSCSADEFKRLFSSFCLLTYSRSKFQLSDEECIDYIKKSLIQQDIKADPTKVLLDLIESICLLQKEGFEISFVHRSFQEYFCALFVSQSPAGIVEKYLNEGQFRTQDSVLPMLFGMVPERVESEWANKCVDRILSAYPKINEKSAFEFAKKIYPSLSFAIFGGHVIHVATEDTSLNRDLNILKRIYPSKFEENNSLSSDSFTINQSREMFKSSLAEIDRLNIKAVDLRQGKGRSPSEVTHNLSKRLTDGSVKIDDNYLALLASIGLIKHFMGILSSIKSIQKDQKEREKRDDLFLKAVFDA